MMNNFDGIFEQFDKLFQNKYKTTRKNSNQVKVENPKNKKFSKKDKVSVTDENGNTIESYWDIEAAKEIQAKKIKRIIKSLHS